MSAAIVMTETGGPEVLKLRAVALPMPNKGQVRIAVMAIGVNPVETYWRAGTQGRNPKLPYTPGRDASGIVDAIGADVIGFTVGDRVFTTGAATGTYAQHCLVDQSDLHQLPDAASFEAGAALGTPAMAAYRALIIRGEARPGDRIFVHGATGGVGTVAVQLARGLGMSVVGTADNQRGVDYLKSLGATAAFIHHNKDYMNEVTKHGPYDVIVECLANVNLGQDLTVLARKGRVAVVGSRGPVEVNPRYLMVTEADIRGVFLTAQTPKEKKQAVGALSAMLAAGTLKPAIACCLSLEEAPEAHRRVVAPNSGLIGKIILQPNVAKAKL